MAGLGIAGNNGMPVGRADMNTSPKIMLNTSIYNYLVSEGQQDAAKALLDSRLPMNHDKIKKEGKNQVNGIDANVDPDSKNENKNRAGNNDMAENALLEYWLIFWDMWTASRQKEAAIDTNGAQYLNRSRQMVQQNMLQSMPVNNYAGAFKAGGMAMNGLRQQAGMQQTLNGPMRRNGMGHNTMQRDGSGMDMNGEQRPHSPSSGGENAPSPKRQRVDGGYGAPQMGGLQRNSLGSQLPNGSIGNPQAMMMQQKGMDPNGRLQYSDQMKQQAQTAMSNLGSNVNNFGFNGNAESPMMAGDQFDPSMMNNQQLRNGINGGANGGNNGNGGALADYQMQLMLLEQQNKRRLLMARQEQEPSMGQPGFGPGHSPHGRNGQSPNGGDMKRPSPNTGQGSPLPEGPMPLSRNSPLPAGFDPGQMNNGLPPQFAGQMNNMGPGGPMMRGPHSHSMNGAQMEMMRGRGHMPNGAWNGGQMPGQMMPQGPVGQTQPDNQQQRNNMPPPSAPTSGGKAQSSPTPQNAAPPTPSQKKEGKAKKETEKSKKKAPKKTQSTTSATPNPENDKQSTPPPSTPVIPVHPEAATIKGQNNNQDQSQAGQQSQQQALVQQNTGQAQPGSMQLPMDNGPFGNFEPDAGGIFSDYGVPDFNGDMGGGTGMNDILEAFDFDSFINDSGVDGATWDGDFALNGGLESGP